MMKYWIALRAALYEELHKNIALSTTHKAKVGENGRVVFWTEHNFGFAEAIHKLNAQIKICDSKIQECRAEQKEPLNKG